MSNNKNSKSDQESTQLVQGKIESHKDGFAFFIPDDKSIKDVFVHPKNLNSATDKDIVMVSIRSFKGRPEGIVKKVISKGLTEVCGIVDIYKGRVYIIPLSKSFRDVIMAGVKSKNVADGDVVICKIKSYPNKNSDIFTADILSRIGNINDIGIDNKIVLFKHNLITTPPDDVLAEVDNLPSTVSKKNDKNITDFKNLYTVTIDGATAKDYDDAISIEATKHGYDLYVHIADVSRYVKRGTLVDDYAKVRGTSIYFPQFAIPMLPENLSNNLCSLLPDVDRYTVTAKISFDKKGVVKEKSFYRSIIQSDNRLTYNFVNDIISEKVESDDNKLLKFISIFRELYEILDAKNLAKDYISFDFPEAIYSFYKDGSIKDISPSDRGISERAIEYFMIAANEAVASFLAETKTPSIYRVHDKPDPKKVDAWVEMARSFGIDIGFPETIDQKVISEFSNIAANSKYAPILSSLLVRSMMRAEYVVDNIGHFGLGSDYYTHFTSPIRRYPDLLVHRALLNKLSLGEKSEDLKELDILAGELTALERLAFEAESEICQFKKIEYIAKNSDRKFECYINRITGTGLSIYLEKVLFVSSIDFADINYDTFIVEKGVAVGRRYNKRFMVGDRLRVTLLSTDISSLQAKFTLADDEKPQSKDKRIRALKDKTVKKPATKSKMKDSGRSKKS